MDIAFTQKEYAIAVEGEHNDCAVRALAVAGQMSYPQAHAQFLNAGRTFRSVTSHECLERVLKTLYPGIKIQFPPRAKTPLQQMILFGYFRKGRYLVITTGHAIAIVDGVVHDWKLRIAKRVRYFYQLP